VPSPANHRAAAFLQQDVCLRVTYDTACCRNCKASFDADGLLGETGSRDSLILPMLPVIQQHLLMDEISIRSRRLAFLNSDYSRVAKARSVSNNTSSSRSQRCSVGQAGDVRASRRSESLECV